MNLTSWIVACLLAAATAFWSFPLQAERADGVTLSPVQTRALAVAAHRAKNPTLARDLALALLQRDPKDSVALQILGAALFALGDFKGSAAAGALAWRSAQTPRQRHDAAMIVADAMFRQDRIAPARFWLRRAAVHAPGPAEKALAVRAYQGLASRQKLTWSVDVGLSPSSNINGGTSSATLVLFGIPFTLSPDAQALSGYAARAGVKLRYKVSENATHRTEIGANLFATEYSLSSKASRAAPTASASDYAFAAVEGVVIHRFATPGSTGPSEVTVTLGRNWYGGDALSNYARIDLGREFAQGRDAAIRVHGGAERQWRLDNSQRSATVLTLGADRSQRLVGGNRLSFGAELRDTRSAANDIDHRAVILNGSYGWAKPVVGAAITTSLSLEARDYPESVYRAGGRHDLRATAVLGLFFPDISYFGFAPQVDIRATQNQSDVSLYDSRDLGVSFGFRSTF